MFASAFSTKRVDFDWNSIFQRARDRNIEIYAIGVGLPDTIELDAIASLPSSEHSFTVENFDKLEGLDEKIFSALCPAG